MSKKSDSDFFVRAARCLAGIQDCGNFRAKKNRRESIARHAAAQCFERFTGWELLDRAVLTIDIRGGGSARHALSR